MYSYILALKDRILKSEFNKNVIILAGGTALAQAVPILISPVLTRLYTPEDFGTLAIFVAITSVVSVIACGRYELAIMLPEKDEDAINVAAVAFLFNIVISGVFFIFILIFGDWLLNLLNAKNLGNWIYLAPLTVFLMGTFNILNYTNNRFKLYKDISKANIYKALAGAVVQVTMGLFKFGTSGLIIGQIVSQIVSNGKLFLNVRHLIGFVNKNSIKELFVRYINFPKFSMWAGLLNVTGYQIVNILIGMFYGPKELGYFYLAFRILAMPTSFIGSAISQVFFKQATDEKNKTGSIEKTFKSTLKKLVILAFPIFGIIFIIVEPVFTAIFGENWRIAGLYIQILVPFFFIMFISSALSITMIIYKNFLMEFSVNVLLIIIPFFLIILKFPFIIFLILYSACLSLLYLIYIILYYYQVKQRGKIT